MRPFLTIFGLLCLLPTFASAGAVKGVRGTKRFHPVGRSLKEEKKCKKFKEPKAVKETVGEPKAVKETVAGPKAMKETVAEPKAVKETATEPKAVKETAPEPKAVKETVAEPKAVKETVAPKAEPKADKVGIEAEEELECLEWEEASDRDDSSSDSTIVTEGAFGSTGTSTDFQSVNVDCDAIANDSGPTDTHSVSFSVNIDLLKDADTGLQDIYSAMEKELQTKVAPRVAGCSSGRMLAEESSKIVNVDFGDFQFSNRGKNGFSLIYGANCLLGPDADYFCICFNHLDRFEHLQDATLLSPRRLPSVTESAPPVTFLSMFILLEIFPPVLLPRSRLPSRNMNGILMDLWILLRSKLSKLHQAWVTVMGYRQLFLLESGLPCLLLSLLVSAFTKDAKMMPLWQRRNSIPMKSLTTRRTSTRTVSKKSRLSLWVAGNLFVLSEKYAALL